MEGKLQRMPRKGLILGKFLPPHRGHVHLVMRARELCDELVVLVGTLEREPIPGALRVEWMRELCPPDVHVVHVTDENPQYPHDHPDFWDIWTSTILQSSPFAPDLVFSSEDYGDELARRLGAEHVLIDLERRAVPTSGTLIRDNPYQHWEHIPECVRPHFVKRVVLTGAESTGKTTLAKRLADLFSTVWVPELARGYIDAKGGFDLSDMEPIGRGQVASEDEAARRANRLLICDTDAIVTSVYSRYYFGTVPDGLLALADSRRADLYLLFDTDVPWVADSQRDLPHVREEMQAMFRESLRSRAIPYTRIHGTWAERERRAIEAISHLFWPKSSG